MASSAHAPVERGLDETSFATSPLHLIAKLRSMAKDDGNEALASLDLDIRLYAVLALTSRGATPTQREISDFIDLDARQIVYLVDRLESRGLVERRPDEADRRLNRIVATDAGQHTFVEAQAAIDSAADTTLGRLDSRERKSLLRLLAKAIGTPAPDGREQGHELVE